METIKKHIISILCILSIILLALPLATIETTIETDWVSTNSSTSISGFQALQSTVVAYLLIVGPVLLIAMNYIKQLFPYKGILAIAVPLVCLFAMIIVVIQAKSFSTSASNDYATAEVKLKIGLGSLLTGISYIATMIAGAIEYHNFSLNKNGLEHFKNSATNIINSAQAHIRQASTQNGQHDTLYEQVKSNGTTDMSYGAATYSTPQNSEAPASASNVNTAVSGATTINSPKKRASANLSRIDEVLVLIERLSKMREAGILTDEEFSDKKRQLLEEIQ